MKTTRLLGIIVIGILILAVFSLVPVQDAHVRSPQGANSLDALASEELFSARIADVIRMDGSFICEIFYRDDTVALQGTVYVAGMRFRADFVSELTQLDQTIDTHSIWDGSTVYSWSSMSHLGTKALATIDTFDAGSLSDTAENQLYTCWEASVNEQLFAVPQDIVFETL